MVVISINQLLNDRTLGSGDRRFAAATIYLVRDGTTIFYIGLSEADVVERLRSHMGWQFRGRSSKTDLGLLIEANLPESEAWVVELYTAEECRWAVPDGESYATISAADAEWSLIRHFKPCLNVTANHERGTPLPERYKRPVDKVAEVLGEFLNALRRKQN